MYYATIKKCDIANGPGVRLSLFVSGCSHHCKGCFNEMAWDYNYGEAYTDHVEQEIIEELSCDYYQGITFLGGEPLDPKNRSTVLSLIKRIRKELPNKDIWCYTGYTYDYLMAEGDPVIREIFDNIDVLVDGKFVEELKDITLLFRGSSNQRLIDMRKTIQTGSIVKIAEN